MLKIFKTKKVNIFKRTKVKLKKVLRIFGPGFVTGAADDDPSGIGTYSIGGARYGLLLAWLIPFQLPLMYVIQETCARIGLVTGKGLAANMKKFFPKPILYSAILILVFANIINIGANISVMGAALGRIFGVNIHFWAIFITILIVLLQIFVPYHFYSKILIILSLFLFAYVITAFMTTQDWLEVLKYTFIPHFKFDKDFILIATGFVGTTISPYLFFWQASHEIEDAKNNGELNFTGNKLKSLLKKVRIDTFVGMFFSQIVALFIVVTCFSTLHKNGITQVHTAYDAAMALEPLAGEWAFIIFTIGIIGAGFLAIPVLAGSTAYALSEIFNFKNGLSYKFKEATFFYSTIAISTVIGLLLNFIGIRPMKALLYAAIINGVSAAPLIACIIILANKTKIMGQHKNSIFSNLVGGFTFCIMILAGIILFI